MSPTNLPNSVNVSIMGRSSFIRRLLVIRSSLRGGTLNGLQAWLLIDSGNVLVITYRIVIHKLILIISIIWRSLRD